MSVNQNVPGCVAAGTNNGCRPNPNLREQRPVLTSAATRTITACICPSCSVRRAGETIASPHTLEVDERCWRELFQLSNRSLRRLGRTGAAPTMISATASSPAVRCKAPPSPVSRRGSGSHTGLQLSGMLQSVSALPFNITSGVTTIQGTPGRPIVNGAFIRRNARIGSDFFQLNVRLSRTFRIDQRIGLEGLVEGFNVTNRTNNMTRNTNFGAEPIRRCRRRRSDKSRRSPIPGRCNSGSD